MDAEEARTIGRRARQVRNVRGKSLAVIAERAGISKSYLCRLEKGQRALNQRSLVIALADALEIAPSELTTLPAPAPADGDTDTTVKALRRALIAVSHDLPGGQVVPVEALRTRVDALVTAQRLGKLDQVGRDLPDLVRDLHASIAAGRDVAELLVLAVLLHVQGSHAFLHDVGAPADLRSDAALLGRHAAREHGAPDMLGMAAFGSANGLLATGELDLAHAVLDSVTVPTTTSQAEQLEGMLALSRSLVAAADRRPGDVGVPLEYAAELAARTGEGHAYGLGFGPTNVGVWRMTVALECGDHAQAATLAEGLRPELLPSVARQAAYWGDYGRVLARLRGRREDAVWALRRAEELFPNRVHRHPFTRDTVAELVARTPRDSSAGRELRKMAHRAGLPV
ncbi:MAG: helix-turn-helix domain-containing protein [Actinomycetota bacterium]|nr:helix-turn-helix domain-containing protein [Actinomycetota bacterium]